ncbi:uncharacterized protein BJX67DRAFT_98886 [Aspergillus lucknowensis]|uniref:Uncharacterized protein n=1 Tax=Aspergillus lucknowensis TaxID=176173 RepID=A0ABR4M664_9EURO
MSRSPRYSGSTYSEYFDAANPAPHPVDVRNAACVLRPPPLEVLKDPPCEPNFTENGKSRAPEDARRQVTESRKEAPGKFGLFPRSLLGDVRTEASTRQETSPRPRVEAVSLFPQVSLTRAPVSIHTDACAVPSLLGEYGPCLISQERALVPSAGHPSKPGSCFK